MNEANAKYHAVFAAYLSLLTGTVGVVISIMTADAELSMSLYGMALIEVIDVAASIMVQLALKSSLRVLKIELRINILSCLEGSCSCLECFYSQTGRLILFNFI